MAQDIWDFIGRSAVHTTIQKWGLLTEVHVCQSTVYFRVLDIMGEKKKVYLHIQVHVDNR